jgi:hypothetical protein
MQRPEYLITPNQCQPAPPHINTKITPPHPTKLANFTATLTHQEHSQLSPAHTNPSIIQGKLEVTQLQPPNHQHQTLPPLHTIFPPSYPLSFTRPKLWAPKACLSWTPSRRFRNSMSAPPSPWYKPTSSNLSGSASLPCSAHSSQITTTHILLNPSDTSFMG